MKWTIRIEANSIEPHAYITHLFTRSPYTMKLEDFEAPLPWTVRASASVGCRSYDPTTRWNTRPCRLFAFHRMRSMLGRRWCRV
jgi:hypothetical protein